MQCAEVPPVRAALRDSLSIRRALEDTKVQLEKYREAKARRRRVGWHAWLEGQLAAGGRKIEKASLVGRRAPLQIRHSSLPPMFHGCSSGGRMRRRRPNGGRQSCTFRLKPP